MEPECLLPYHKCPQPFTILSGFYSVHKHTCHVLKIHLVIILLCTPRPPKRPFSRRNSHRNPLYASLLTHRRYKPDPSNSSRFYHQNTNGCGVEVIKFFNMYFSPISCYLQALMKELNVITIWTYRKINKFTYSQLGVGGKIRVVGKN